MSFDKKSASASSSPPKRFTRKGRAVEEWEKQLFKVFGGQIERKPVLEEQDFTNLDPRCATSEIKSTQKLTLRAAEQVSNNEEIILKKFDPNFMSPQKIQCRSPGCKEAKKRQLSSSGPRKEDLYICARHRKILQDYTKKICADKGIDVSTRYSPGDFDGYASMIGLLENAFLIFVKRPPGSEDVLKGKPPDILKEVFINLRNFLMITNALLNPLLENLITVLPRVMETFKEILKILSSDGEIIVQRLTEMVGVLRSLMQDILFVFGIVYSWVYMAVTSNPGTQIGAGIGGFIGMAGLFVGGPAVGLLAMAAGSLFGGLTGSGIYNLLTQRRPQEEADENLRRYQDFVQMQRNQEDNPQGMAEDDRGVVFYITGSEMGDLCLVILSIAQLMYFGM